MRTINVSAMEITQISPRIAPTGLRFQGRGVSAGSLGSARLRVVRDDLKRDSIAFERDSRPGAATV